MRKALIAAIALTALFTWSGAATGANGDNLRTIIAVRTAGNCISNSPSGGHGYVGTGIAFDGTNLLLSCWADNVITAVSPADGSNTGTHLITNASDFGAMAWDNGRGLLWVCQGFNKVGTIDLTTNTYTYGFSVPQCVDGLAYDGADDSIWLSPDVSSVVYHYTTAGALLGSFAVAPVMPTQSNSGIAVGGTKLYLANNGYSQIYEVEKDFSSGSLFATFPARIEDLECDNITFASSGKAAIWSQDAYDNVLNAWEIPDGACLFGGGRSELSLDPPTATNDVGTSHTVTATLTDRDGPIAGATVLFSVSGANSASGTGTTNASGEATFTYSGTNAGLDTITACYDKNGNGSCDGDEPRATASKEWVVRNAELTITKTGPASIEYGSGNVTYTITASNAGPATAMSVVVTDTLSGPGAIVAASAGCTFTATTATCNLGNLAPGGSATVTITVAPATVGTLHDAAHVDSPTLEFDETNNDASADTRVVDTHAPSASCTEAPNPSGKNVPTAGTSAGKSGQNPDGFYYLRFADNVGIASAVVTMGSFTSNPFANGAWVKLTQTPGGAGSDTRPGPGGIDAHVKGPGDPTLVVTDTSGNVTRVSCLVPPPPK